MRTIVYGIFSLLFFFAVFYWARPVVAFGYFGFPFALLTWLYLLFSLESSNRKRNESSLYRTLVFGSSGFMLLFILVVMFTTWGLFHHQAYRAVIGEVKEGADFAELIGPAEMDHVRLVDEEMAYRLGDKVLGAQPSLGSQVHLGDFSIQQVNGKLYWVAPLVHSGWFKWWNNREGTPGYVKVSASNERDVELVQQVGGKDIFVKYQMEAFASEQLHRHIYFSGYMTRGFTDFSFEIDDQGTPYWVVTLYEPKVGFGGDDANGVLVVNAQDGSMTEYSIADAPAWVDRIQPLEFIQSQLDNWGEYVNGYINFANENKLTTTAGMSLIYGKSGRSYWYTGLTSVGADEGTVGFVLVDTRTKETIWFKQAGATEAAAQQSAQGKVQEKGYWATFPIPYNIGGVPTYVMSLKDQAGLNKMVAMVSVEDFTLVGVGNNIDECLRDYRNNLNAVSRENGPTASDDLQSLAGRVARMASAVRGGNTLFYLVLSGQEGKIFIGTSQVSEELPLTQAGDSVRLWLQAQSTTLDISRFDNLELGARAAAAAVADSLPPAPADTLAIP